MRLAVVERMAHEGVREMQFLLGFLKESGLGFSKNIAEAHDWYRRLREYAEKCGGGGGGQQYPSNSSGVN